MPLDNLAVVEVVSISTLERQQADTLAQISGAPRQDTDTHSGDSPAPAKVVSLALGFPRDINAANKRRVLLI